MPETSNSDPKARVSPRVLVVDDDLDMLDLVRDVAEGLNLSVETAGDRRGFQQAYHRLEPTIVLLDLQMPDADGVEILGELHDLGCTASIVLMSGFDRRVLKSAQDFGLSKGLKIEGTVEKPVPIDVLEELLTRAVAPLARPSTVAPRQDIEILAGDLRQAIAKGQLFLRYQPKLTLGRTARSDRIQAVEALVRWRHEWWDEIPPDRFIGLAETNNLIAAMTEFVFRVAAEQTARWHADGTGLAVAVNLSPVLLEDLSLPNRLAGLVRGAGADPAHMTIEVTETAVMRDTDAATEIMTRFRLNNFGLSIDDFGTGHSSLVELYRMPFNELKIDRAFVGKMSESEEARVIVRSLVNLAHDLGLTACAEGAEDMDTIDFLRQLGCDYVQGYAIAKPLNTEEIAGFLVKANADTGIP